MDYSRKYKGQGIPRSRPDLVGRRRARTKVRFADAILAKPMGLFLDGGLTLSGWDRAKVPTTKQVQEIIGRAYATLRQSGVKRCQGRCNGRQPEVELRRDHGRQALA